MPEWSHPPARDANVPLKEISHVLERLDGLDPKLTRDAFVRSWLYEGTPEDDDLVAAAERYFERAVNALIELFDIVEKEAIRAGAIPDVLPDAASKADRAAWFASCRDRGLAVKEGPHPHNPGRWRRGAIYRLWPHDDVYVISGIIDARKAFQHGYGTLAEQAADEAWSVLTGHRDRLREMSSALATWLDELE